jgi:hypothetical protein
LDIRKEKITCENAKEIFSKSKSTSRILKDMKANYKKELKKALEPTNMTREPGFWKQKIMQEI